MSKALDPVTLEVIRNALPAVANEMAADLQRTSYNMMIYEVRDYCTSLVNPKGYAAMAALFSGFALLPQQPAIDAILKIGLLFVVIAAVNIAWLLAGSGMTGLFRDPRSNRIVNLVFAAFLLLSLAAAIKP